jgi:hypothetical protein
MVHIENMSFGSGNGSAIPATSSGISHFRRDSLGSPSDRPKDDPVDVKSNTVLERSHNFLPISPISSTSVPPIMITAFWQVSESQVARINAYRVLFLVSTNVRRQLTISPKIPKTSKYWTTTRVSKEPFSCTDCMNLAEAGSLPQTLQDRVYPFLSGQDGLHEMDHIARALSDEDEALKVVPQDRGLQQTYPAKPLPLSSPGGRLTMAAYLENLRCSLYSEQDFHTIATSASEALSGIR